MDEWNDHWELIFNAEIMKHYANKKNEARNGVCNLVWLCKMWTFTGDGMWLKRW